MEFEHPEERMAKRLVYRRGLNPPIDIEKLISEYSILKRRVFPINIDGISVGLKQPGKKPRVYLNEKSTHRRQRFTLAHELGHILIPWHTGTIVDELDLDNSKEQSKYWEMESEANRFASELLMPELWVKKICQNYLHLSDIAQQISNDADVSIDSAVLRAIKYGPKGFIVSKSDNRSIIWSSRTNGTLANPPQRGDLFSKDLISPIKSYEVIGAYGGYYHFWEEQDEYDIPYHSGDDWRDILNLIVKEVDSRNPEKLKQSINGIMAFANSSIKMDRTKEKIYAACLLKIQNRNDSNYEIGDVIVHPFFLRYVAAKVRSFNL